MNFNKVVECVPNFSEGRDQKIIEKIAEAIRSTPNVELLDVDSGYSTNRTVYTFVGDVHSVQEGALAAAKTAHTLIDMTKHQGEHPRLGAMDVCPFIPISPSVTVEDCVEIARDFAGTLSETLSVPVFLYGLANGNRTTVPQIRAGEYEGLKERFEGSKKGDLNQINPSFGAHKFVPRWGASIVGVRKLLIAYNINVIGGTKEEAHRIALNLREQGRKPKGEEGRLKAVQAIGWYLEEHNLAQVSMNLSDMDVTPIHVAFEEAKKDAKSLKVAISGSEIVGLVPLRALLDAAEHYIKHEDLFILDEDQKVKLAVNKLGLSSISHFNVRERIIEYVLSDMKRRRSEKDIHQEEEKLTDMSVEDFIKSVNSRTATPGGGSVSACVGSMGCALASMVGKLSHGKKQFEAIEFKMRPLILTFHKKCLEMIPEIHNDSKAFDEYTTASRQEAISEDLKAKRMEKGLEKAISIPFEISQTLNSIWFELRELAKDGNINCASDLQVAAKCIETAIYGAICNVKINLITYSTKDREEVERTVKSLDDAWEKAQRECVTVLNIINQRIEQTQ